MGNAACRKTSGEEKYCKYYGQPYCKNPRSIVQVIASRIPGTFPPGCPMKCEFNDRNRAKGGKENQKK